VRSAEPFAITRVETDVKGLRVISFLFVAIASAHAQTAIEIDLQEQTAFLIRNGRVALATPIASGRYGHLTPTGSFKVIEKERNHFSTIYGKIVDARGNTVVADADADMRVPPGGKFIPAPMRYFLRFNGANGLHAGYLPGYPASHGCVRLPEENAIAIFNSVEVGTPVNVFGRTPAGRSFGSRSTMYHSRDPRFGPRMPPPWWWR
jgi:lipoprotein-anchoring transpeptidase ErfK/SrfK